MSTIKRNYEIYCEDNESNLSSKNKTPSKKFKTQKHKNLNQIIFDDENKLLSLKTKSTGFNNSTPKIIDIFDSDEDELLSLETNDTTAANNNKDDFTYTINDVRFLRITIDRLVPGYYEMKGYMLMYEHLMKNTAVWEPNLGTDINKQEFIQEVIIPELGVMFIMTDLKVNDYDTAVIIMCKSVEYGNQNFFGDSDDNCFW
ncbi:45872_t:CDS:2 [Gigaspora margarita]|uniref:Restriction of telomere capping protein 4 n=1 Tax=Gigaspora margarita TaxID=4874 RepID=A0ABN7VTD2_GIGMA|nr:45872_t:CDS:2 [Gigaspora margarita]